MLMWLHDRDAIPTCGGDNRLLRNPLARPSQRFVSVAMFTLRRLFGGACRWLLLWLFVQLLHR